MNELGRRAFLEVSLSFVPGVGLLLAISCDGRREERVLRVETGFPDAESLAAAGRSYLETADEDLAALLDQLRLERGWDAVDAEIRSQYRTGDTVLVDGWLLATTEARLYALFALRAGERQEPPAVPPARANR